MSASVSSSSAPLAEREVQQVKLPDEIIDKHGGVIVEMNEAMDPQLFVSLLRDSVSYWREQGIKGAWIKLPIGLVNLVEPAVKEGFRYHHAEPNYLMLVRWLPAGTHALPANASHRVKIGAFVMNDKREKWQCMNELNHSWLRKFWNDIFFLQGNVHLEHESCFKLLVVQEKKSKFKDIWKLPTGVVEEGEDLCMAAIREVKEETSIVTEFIEVLGFRQSHRAFFGKSELLFVCLLKPCTFDVKAQESEIEAAQWMPLEEYRKQDIVKKEGVFKRIFDICIAKVDGSYSGFSPVSTRSNFSDQSIFFYINEADLKQSST